jgi:hypothetical protein
MITKNHVVTGSVFEVLSVYTSCCCWTTCLAVEPFLCVMRRQDLALRGHISHLTQGSYK